MTMRKPEFKHVLHDVDINVTFTIYAHRKLTRAEIDATILSYQDVKLGQITKKHIEIISMIGYRARGSRH